MNHIMRNTLCGSVSFSQSRWRGVERIGVLPFSREPQLKIDLLLDYFSWFWGKHTISQFLY